LKFCRKVNSSNPAAITTQSSRLSLTTAGSSINAALGNVSAGGMGTPELDVTQTGGGPCALEEVQSGGKAGGITASKFSLNSTGRLQGGHERVGMGGAVAVEI
jgi:hypothetical protein